MPHASADQTVSTPSRSASTTCCAVSLKSGESLHTKSANVIAVRSAAGAEIARGLANYASTEARLIARKPSSQIAGLLGFANEPELIHRDNLVLS